VSSPISVGSFFLASLLLRFQRSLALTRLVKSFCNVVDRGTLLKPNSTLRLDPSQGDLMTLGRYVRSVPARGRLSGDGVGAEPGSASAIAPFFTLHQ
jgi:hypothetical protein